VDVVPGAYTVPTLAAALADHFAGALPRQRRARPRREPR
jgi:hypothetical protein